MDIEESLTRLVSFANGAFSASGNQAFEEIRDNLISVVDEMFDIKMKDCLKINRTPIEELKLTMRTMSCLKAEKIMDVYELTNCTDRRLREIPNLGLRSLNEIKTVLAELGLSLKRE